MRTLLFFSLLSIFSLFADDVIVPSPETINPTEFFMRISGQYTVDLAGGEKPHEGTNVGLVMIDGTDGLMSFSYCLPDGMCDPNDQYFPLDKTTIVKTVISPTATSYELSFSENGVKKRFTWDEVENKIILKNYQYMVSEKTVTLEHQLHRKVEEIALPVNSEDFFKSHSGRYEILKMQGEPPHKLTIGQIEIIDNEGLISFPYCVSESACHPNDQYFPLDKTSITSTSTDAGVTYTIVTVDGQGERRYTLQENSDLIKLKNYQFELNGTKITLEHEAKRISNE